MFVPDELAFVLHDLQLVVVDIPGDPGAVRLVEESELLRQTHLLVHGSERTAAVFSKPLLPASSSKCAALTSGTWLKACGRLPSCLARRGSYSSARRRTSVQSESRCSNSVCASSRRSASA